LSEKGPILVVSPHPDDAAFFMGGTLATRLREGHRVDLWCMSGGERGTVLSFLSSARKSLAALRSAELRAGSPAGANLRLREFAWPDGCVRIEQSEIAELDRAHAELGSPEYVEVFLPEYDRRHALFRHRDHLCCGEGLRTWIRAQPWGAGAILRYYHSKAGDYRVAVSDEVHRDALTALRKHRSQYGVSAFPPALLVVGEYLRERWLRREGFAIGAARAESFRTEANSTLV
jgi:LmbE family N-acetylglucosaminyl deacetylase